MSDFPVVTVDSRNAEAIEPLGTKRKFWYDGRRFLFKAEERGTGEDWAEKLASELCDLIGLPHVAYELAIDEGQKNAPGVICANFTPPPLALAHGNQLLLALDEEYPAGDKYRVREHTVDAVSNIIEALEPPSAEWLGRCPNGIESAVDVFVGYIMLDAWIANQDRHHENWGAVWDGAMLRLAPTFDHGASMARNLSDDERHERLTTNDHRRQIPYFAARALSAFFANPGDAKPLKTLDAWSAFARRSPHAAAIWLGCLRHVDTESVAELLARVPSARMSAVCRDFTLQLLEVNRNRLLESKIE